jgi:hypothetical protein
MCVTWPIAVDHRRPGGKSTHTGKEPPFEKGFNFCTKMPIHKYPPSRSVAPMAWLVTVLFDIQNGYG